MAAQAGLCLAWSETPEHTFCRVVAQVKYLSLYYSIQIRKTERAGRFCSFDLARQDYFTHFEPSQSLGGAKTGDPREKPPGHPQAELDLSHMRPELGSNP